MLGVGRGGQIGGRADGRLSALSGWNDVLFCFRSVVFGIRISRMVGWRLPRLVGWYRTWFRGLWKSFSYMATGAGISDCSRAVLYTGRMEICAS